MANNVRSSIKKSGSEGPISESGPRQQQRCMRAANPLCGAPYHQGHYSPKRAICFGGMAASAASQFDHDRGILPDPDVSAYDGQAVYGLSSSQPYTHRPAHLNADTKHDPSSEGVPSGSSELSVAKAPK